MMKKFVATLCALALTISSAYGQSVPGISFPAITPVTTAASFSLVYITSFQCGADPCTSTTVNFGSEDTNRDILVTCHCDDGCTGITSVTIAGTTASDDITATTSGHVVTIRRAAKPTGTTNQTVTCDIAGTSGDDTAVGVWALYAAFQSPGTTDDEASATGASSATTSAVTIPTGGAAVFACTDDNEGGYTWTNATGRYDIDGGTVTGATGADTSSAGTPTVTCDAGNGTTLVGASYDDN